MLARILRTLGLARLSDVEHERLEAARIRTAERDRARKERESAAGRIDVLTAKLADLRERLRASASRAAHAREEQRQIIAGLRARAAAAEAALDRAKAKARAHKAARRSMRARVGGLLAARVRTLSQGSNSAAPLVSPGPERLGADYVDVQTRWTNGERPLGVRHVRIGGLDWSVPAETAADGSLSHRILAHGWLPLDDIAFVRQFVVGGVMLDIGANIGTTSIPRVVLGDFDRAYAAEPNCDNYFCLVGNVLQNGLAGRVLPSRLAISSSNGSARLRQAGTIGGHRLAATADDAASETVRCLTLDSWVAEVGAPADEITFVKVDTQGWDVHVLQGACALLQRRRAAWQIEVSPPMMRAAGSSLEDLCALAAAYFTDVVLVDDQHESAVAPVAALGHMLASTLSARRFVNILLLNTR